MNQNTVAVNDDDEVVFKIKRSAIAEALRSDFEMPIPVTDENIEVVDNQITALIEEFPTGVPTEFFDLGIDHHKGIDFYRKVYGLLDGPRCGTAWASEDSSLVYFAVTDEAGGLTVFHVPSAALAQIDRRDQGDLHGLSGAIRDLHVDDAYAESDRVLEFARNSPAAAAFGSGSEPELGFYGVVYLYREDGKIDFSAAVDHFAFKADGREKACGREYVPAGGKLYDDEFITLRWRRKDIADSLEDDWGNFGFPIPATEENVEWAMDQLGNHIDDAIHAAGWGIIHDCLDPNSFDLGVGHGVQAKEFYEQVFDCDGDYDSTVNVWPSVDGSGVHVSAWPVTPGGCDLAVYSVDAGKIGDEPITVRDLEDIGTREVHVDNFAEKPEEVRFFLRTDADVYLFGSSLGKSLEVEDRAGEDIAPALREVRTYCKDATEKRDPQLICAKAQAAAAKSATAEGEAGGKKL